MGWTGGNYAYGRRFNRACVSADLDGCDYVIFEHGTHFHDNLNVAKAADIPAFLLYRNDPELMEEYGMNPKNWADDKNTCLQEIIYQMALQEEFMVLSSTRNDISH